MFVRSNYNLTRRHTIGTPQGTLEITMALPRLRNDDIDRLHTEVKWYLSEGIPTGTSPLSLERSRPATIRTEVRPPHSCRAFCCQ